MESSSAYFCLALVTFFGMTHCVPQQGLWNKTFNAQTKYYGFQKVMYNNTKISVRMDCKVPGGNLKIGWLLRLSPCIQEFLLFNQSHAMIYFTQPTIAMVKDYNNTEMAWFMSPNEETCPTGEFTDQTKCGYETCRVDTSTRQLCKSSLSKKELPAEGCLKYSVKKMTSPTINPETVKTQASVVTEAPNKPKTPGVTIKAPTQNTTKAPVKQRRKRDEEPAVKPGAGVVTQKAKTDAEAKIEKDVVMTTWREGSYLFIIYIDTEEDVESDDYSIDVTVRTTLDGNYISALDWPLLVFYGVMVVVYVVLGFIWLVLMACNHKDLLRVQFWIAGVILLGMLEKSIFFSEYHHVNSEGTSVSGLVVFAEIMSCGKRTIARMIVIIISLGFGVVKPRLGPMLQRVLLVGGLYFIFASVEGTVRSLKGIGEYSNYDLLLRVPLAVTDACICWWIFTSIRQTTKALRLRRNIPKLSLYRIFTNVLIITVLVSVIFMSWIFYQNQRDCNNDWEQLWLEDAFWHLLFSVLLIVIMFLWRPSANAQRFAFSPLLDADDEEDNTIVMNDAFDGMKMRGSKMNGSPRDYVTKADDDLKWVEDNIPATMAEKVLPSLLDSDEEVNTSKFEISKME